MTNDCSSGREGLKKLARKHVGRRGGEGKASGEEKRKSPRVRPISARYEEELSQEL